LISKNKTAKQKKNPAGFNRSTWLVAGAISFFAFLLYAQTLGYGFVLDDSLVTTLNQFVREGFGGLGDIFTHAYRAGASISTDSEYMYRPLSVAMFAVEWTFAPNTPGIHHLINVLLYALSAGLLYLLLAEVTKDSHPLLAIGAALLFVAHPLHTEVVANIKSRDEILCLFFSLLMLHYYWGYARHHSVKKLVMALIAFLLALLAKEGAVVFILLLPLFLYFFDYPLSITMALKKSLWILLPFCIWFLLRMAVMDGHLVYTPHVNDNQLVSATLSERWATGFMILAKYLQLLVWPAVLSWDYSFRQIQTAAWSDPLVYFSLILHAGLLAFAIWGFRKRNLYTFCILAYLVSLGLYANMVYLIGTLFGERLVYTASLWFCLGMSLLLVRSFQIKRNRKSYASLAAYFDAKGSKAFAGVLLLLVMAMSVRTIYRNLDWKDNFTLFVRDGQHAPNSFRALFSAGNELLIKFANAPDTAKDTTQLHEAKQYYENSLAIRPTQNAYTGLGNIAYFQKRYSSAIADYSKALELEPNQSVARQGIINTYNELARIESQVNQNQLLAEEYLRHALSYDSLNVPALNSLGTVYAVQNQLPQAIRYFEKALALEPDNKDVLRNLSIAYQGLGNAAKAEEFAKRVSE
jgi:tetratricopeptide (TPR) repeat protein